MPRTATRAPLIIGGVLLTSAAGAALWRRAFSPLRAPSTTPLIPPGTASRVAALATALQLPAATVMAIQSVESRGHDDAVRFEPHLFLKTRPDLTDQIAYTPSGVPGSPSYVASETNRAALARAAALDNAAAVKATSWGAYQVLGGRGIAEYGTAAAFTSAFWSDPAGTSDRLLISWFKVNPKALAAARKEDWSDFVKRYNGPGGAAAGYPGKLAAALDAAKAQLGVV